MRFLLSIHDVWPGNRALVAGYLARLRSLGATRIALLVVPAYHGNPPMDLDPDFISWLRAESAAGSELFLHGYRHLIMERPEAAGSPARRNAYGRWVNRALVAQEAEFCGLAAADRERLFELGLDIWKRTGLPLAGFVAPTWHGAPPPSRMREAGLALWESRFHLRRLADGAARFVPPLAWGPARENRGPVLAGGRLWLRVLRSLPAIKVAVHPGDLESPAALRVLETLLATGTNSAYKDFFRV